MALEVDLKQVRDELDVLQSQMRKSRRRAFFGFTILILAFVLALGYGFVQQVAAVRNAEEANRQHSLADACEKQAMTAQQEFLRRQEMAEEARLRAEKMLEECRKGKR